MTPAKHPPPVRVVIADDDPIVLESLAAVLAGEASFELVATARDADEAIAQALRLRPDVVLVDVQMPAGGGPRATREIVELLPQTAVVALSANDDRDSVFRMIEAGAIGYLIKGCAASEVLATIERTARRESTLSPQVARHLVGRLSVDLRAESDESERRLAIEASVRAAIAGEGLKIVFQPIVLLATGKSVGYEALARFSLEPQQSPDRWFSDAETIGRRIELELEAMARALAALSRLPNDHWLAVNISPPTLLSTSVTDVFAGVDVSRIVLEVTEEAPIEDYGVFSASIATLREQGLRLAVDDAGAGFASLRHILNLEPDIIKIDRTLIEHVDTDRRSRALAVGFVGFATELKGVVLAEGIERPEQLRVLGDLGVSHGQGYLLGRPAPLP